MSLLFFFGRRVRNVLFLLALAAGPPVVGQDRILTVNVRNEDGTPAAGSIVRLESPLTGQVAHRTAGPEGTVVFSGLPERRYLATAAGADRSAAPVEVTAGSPPVDLVLYFRAVREEVVVSAAGAPRPGGVADVLVTAIPSEELDDRGEWLVADALRGVPGVSIRQNGGPGHLVTASVRGVPGPGTAVVVDGAPLRDVSGTQADASALLPSVATLGISRVEIRRGGGSSLYGTNGMGGVIHIITRGADAGPRFAADLGLGTRGRTRAGGSFGADGDGAAFSGGVTRTGFSGGATGDDRFTNLGGVGRLSLEAGGIRIGGRIFAATAGFGLTESPFPVGPLPAGVVEAKAAPTAVLERFEEGTPAAELDTGGANFLPDAVDPDGFHRTRYLAAQVALSGALGTDGAWSLRGNDLTTLREVEDGPLGTSLYDPPILETTRYEGGVRGVSGRLSTRAGAHDLTLGGDGEWERMLVENPISDTEARQSIFAAFVQDEVRWAGDRARLRGALRLQRFATGSPVLWPREGSPFADVPDPEGGLGWSGDISGGVAVTDAVRFRGSWARGFRAPSLYERFGSSYSSFGYSVYGDPRLAPEFTHVRDVGATVAPADGRFDAEVAWFQAERPQVIAFSPLDMADDPFGRSSGYANTGAGSARGLEAGVRLALPGSLRARGSFTWTDADPSDNAPNELPSAWLLPEQEGSLLLSGRQGRFSWSLDLHLTSAFHAPMFDPGTFSSRVFRFRGMRRIDGVAGWEVVQGLRVRLRVRDALDDRAFESGGFRPLGRVIEAGIRCVFR